MAASGDPIRQAHEIGQSFWLDYIRRDLVEYGQLERLIGAGEIRGVTSNPSIFQQAIGGSELYDAAMRPLAHAGWTADRIFEKLAVHDIRAATDLFLPLYEGSDGRDGFVSIEVSPRLADDSAGTLEEARRLWQAVNRPNLMVKIPATRAGIPAIEQAIAEGININVTLIFALERYAEVMQAYLRGLERRVREGFPLDRVASVASFFVSRVDTAVDRQLEQIVREEGPNAQRAASLMGHAAIANAKLAYAQFKSVFGEQRFEDLKQKGARVQRPLWASTSTKNAAYSDVLYVEQLIGPDTVNTLPPKTLDAFRDHGDAQPMLERNLSEAVAQLEAIEGLGVSLQSVTEQLEHGGVDAFANSYNSLIEIVGSRAAEMRDELGQLQAGLGGTLEQLDAERVAARYWRQDATLWPKDGDRPVRSYTETWRQLLPTVEGLQTSGVQQIAWLVAGGLSLTADSRSISQVQLRSLDPTEQRMAASDTPVDSTFFVAGTDYLHDPAVEAMLLPMWERAHNRLGAGTAQHFLIVAPPGSALGELGERLGIRRLECELSTAMPLLEQAFVAPPAAALLDSADRFRLRCAPQNMSAENGGLYLGALLSLAVRSGIRRLGLLADPDSRPAAEWLAARLRESGLGTQVAVSASVPAEAPTSDRMVVYLQSTGEQDQTAHQLLSGGVPVLRLELDRGLGGEAVRWEMGLGVAAHLLELDPHPSSIGERANARFAQAIERSRKGRRLNWHEPEFEDSRAIVWWSIGEPAGDTLQQFAQALAERLTPGSVLNLSVFRRQTQVVQRTVEELRRTLAGRGVDLTLSYGCAPRSAAWLAGSGAPDVASVNLIVSEASKKDQPVPNWRETFGELQLMFARAIFEQMRSDQMAAGLLHFRSPATINNWLRSLIELLK